VADVFSRLKQIWIFLADFHKFRLIPSSGSRADSADRQTDRQTDGQTDGKDESNRLFLLLREGAEK
jgi:hypothetical protein